MRETIGSELAGNHAGYEFGHAFDARSEALAKVLIWTIRLWCLPFLLLAWALTWTAIMLIRGTNCCTAIFHQGRGRWAAGAWHPTSSS